MAVFGGMLAEIGLLRSIEVQPSCVCENDTSYYINNSVNL